MTSIRNLSRACLALLVAAALVAAGPSAMAGAGLASATDRVHLKDGTVVEGEIKQEMDGYVWIVTTVGGVKSEKVYEPDEIERIERDAEAGDSDSGGDSDAGEPDENRGDEARASNGSRSGDKARSHSGPRGAVLSLGEGLARGAATSGKGMVGMYITADALKRARELLKEQDIDVVVLHIDSGGGASLELQPLSDELHHNYKREFRTVAWIDSAISAAAMTAHCLNEIYFKPHGTYGASTEFRGGGVASKGIDLEDVLYQMERISARGGHDPKIMRSMQIMEPLSATILDNGTVEWYQSTEGEHVVNPEGRVLTFTAPQAEKFKFSQGTAATLDELSRLMGYSEIEWVGEEVDGVAYPVCEAERFMRDFRERVAQDQERLGQVQLRFNAAIEYAQQVPREERAKFVNRARQALRQIRRMVDNNPNFARLTFGMLPEEFEQWVREQEELLRELMN